MGADCHGLGNGRGHALALAHGLVHAHALAHAGAHGLVRDLVHRLGRVDRDLAQQIRRAASSVALNIAEGSGRAGRDRLHCYRIARASTLEVQAGLRLAVAWRHVGEDAIVASLDRIDDLLAMLTGLLR